MKELESIKKKKLSKSERNSIWILKRIHKHDVDSGGIFGIITGSQGSGKTSTMLSFVDYTIKHYPNEKIFWSSAYKSPLQFLKLPMKDIHIMIKENSGVRIYDRKDKHKDITDQIDITYFDDYNDLYKKAKKGMCNCVFFGNRTKWRKFISYLRISDEWVHIFIDELSEISPLNMSGKEWREIGDFSMNLKEVRKCMINVHANTQALQDVDFRVLTKVMVQIFLPGARTTKNSRLTQNAIDNLKEDEKNGNQSYLEYSGRFGKTQFKNIYKPTKYSWEARTNEG